MKSYLEIGLRSFQLKVVRGKLKVWSCKGLPDLSFLLSMRPIVGREFRARGPGKSGWGMCRNTVQKSTLSTLALRLQRKLSLLNFEHIHL